MSTAEWASPGITEELFITVGYSHAFAVFLNQAEGLALLITDTCAGMGSPVESPRKLPGQLVIGIFTYL